MTSGGLGTMGYGLPAAVGVQVAHPDSLVIDIAGDASIQMCIQEMSCAVQYNLPIKIFILNNQYMGMVRQWQQLLHGNRLSNSYTEAMPDFVKLAEAYGGVGIRCEKPGDLDDGDPGDDRSPAAGDLRLPRRQSRQLLPDDPLGQGAQRDAAAGRSHGRSGRQCDRRQGPRSWFEDREKEHDNERTPSADRLRLFHRQGNRKGRKTTRFRFSSTTSRAFLPGSSACSPAAATTSRA